MDGGGIGMRNGEGGDCIAHFLSTRRSHVGIVPLKGNARKRHQACHPTNNASEHRLTVHPLSRGRGRRLVSISHDGGSFDVAFQVFGPSPRRETDHFPAPMCLTWSVTTQHGATLSTRVLRCSSIVPMVASKWQQSFCHNRNGADCIFC